MSKLLEEVQLKNTVKVLMPDEFLLKVKYLCKLIAQVEWSGILFYSINGTIKNLNTFSIVLQDILPMDKGSGAYTEYEIDKRYVDYLMDKPEAMEWHMGHIHSHHSMRVFFSGTDMEELHDNSEGHNFYLSLIVNNYMDFMAKIGFRASIDSNLKDIPFHAKDENGDDYIITKTDVKIKKEKLFIVDCEVQSKAELVSVDKDFATKVDGIINPPVVVPPQRPAQRIPQSFQQGKQWERPKKPWEKYKQEIEDFNKSFSKQEEEEESK